MTTYDEWKTTNPADRELGHAKQRPRIKTSHVRPPIPTRAFDWCAYYEGQEEPGPYGWGATEADAMMDLTENYDEPEYERDPDEERERRRDDALWDGD